MGAVSQAIAERYTGPSEKSISPYQIHYGNPISQGKKEDPPFINPFQSYQESKHTTSTSNCHNMSARDRIEYVEA